MIIIFEGADGVGKSTAVATMVDALQRIERCAPRVLHRGPPSRDPLLEYTVDLECYGPDDVYSEEWVLCDRWHWGELIYGPLYRGKSLLSGAGHRAVDEYLARRGAVIVHLDAPADIVLQRVNTRGDDYVDITHLPFIIDEYRRIREMDSPVYRQTMMDFDEVSAKHLIKTARTVAHRRSA